MKHLFKFCAHGAFAGRITAALYIGGILKQREHAFFAVLGEGVKVEELIVGGSGVDFEIASMDDHTNRSMNRKRHAIDEAMGHANGINCERSDAETVTRPDLIE